MAKMMPPSGRMLLDTMKSSMLEMSPMPGMAMPLHTFMPSTHGMLSTASKTPLRMTACLRDQPQRSMHHVTSSSNTPMTVERAAKPMNTKNSAPHTLPKGIWPNTTGSVWNTSDGPASGLMP